VFSVGFQGSDNDDCGCLATLFMPIDFLAAVPTADSHDAYLGFVFLIISICIWFVSEGILKDPSQ
jgi:hypothetical protein